MARLLISWVLGMIGAAAGGVVGYFAFHWLWNQNFYALVLPGGMVGIGCALLARHSSVLRGLVCGVAAVPVGLFSEWSIRPFIKDDSFGYFLGHIQDLKALTLIFLLLGILVAYWCGRTHYFGSDRPPKA